MADRTGQQLGNYRLVRLLGRGDFAEVYLGEHLHLNMQAAIKVLYTRVTDEDLENFHREAQIIASLVHPHIARVFDYNVEDGTPFLVMDYAPGGTLRKHHPKGTQVPFPTLVSYVKQVAQALQYAHEAKLIHRDLKPENMLLGRRNEVLLSDFGIALMMQSSRLHSLQGVAGTAYYMAPEQLQGKPDFASDQYALGVVVYEWLCGVRPFQGTFLELYSQHLFVPPLPLHEKVPSIPRAVEQVVLTALEKDPHKRFASVQAFAIALEQASRLASSHSVFLPHEISNPNQPSLSTLTAAAVPPNQFSQQVDAVLPPNQMLQSTYIVASQSQSSEPINSISTPYVPASTPPTPGPVPSGEPQLLQPSQRRISRRTVLVSLTGLAIGLGSVTWLVFSQKPQSSIRPLNPAPSSFPLGTPLLIYRGHSTEVDAVAWSPDGKRLASGSYREVRVWDAANGDTFLTYQGHSDFVLSLGWSPDEKYIASGSLDQTAQVWYADSGSNVVVYRGHDLVDAVAWSPDGKRIASGSFDKTVQIWDAATGSQLFTYRGHAGIIKAVAWSLDGRRIASAGQDDATVQIWNVTNGEHVYSYRGHLDIVTSVAWSPEGKRIASSSLDNTIQVWQAV